MSLCLVYYISFRRGVLWYSQIKQVVKAVTVDKCLTAIEMRSNDALERDT